MVKSMSEPFDEEESVKAFCWRGECQSQFMVRSMSEACRSEGYIRVF